MGKSKLGNDCVLSSNLLKLPQLELQEDEINLAIVTSVSFSLSLACHCPNLSAPIDGESEKAFAFPIPRLDRISDPAVNLPSYCRSRVALRSFAASSPSPRSVHRFRQHE
ncbi:hypothetical protein BHE74_00018062 [Ensete ventricosum]|nr:hypothetical protein GW17_00037140 [Ensete ventricosum]RWW74020.1 hypothetical protein BHE74_00018062 [Ensete ventricosum]RZR83331.1 hypothetical protein BHM03_00009934 [Ensete ventricosum]